MRISKRRIRSTENYLSGIPAGGNFYIGLTGINGFMAQLRRIGFDQNIIIGQQVLPTIIGSVTKFNADGGYIIRRDLPKETVYRQIDFKDWHGNYHTKDIPYERYPRDPVSAPNVELLVRNGADNNPLILSPIQNNNPLNMERIKHVVNLFLEIFGECEVLQDNLLPAFNVQVTRLNWDILPAGNYPWQVLLPRVQGVINATNQQRRLVIQRNIERISNHNPNFVAVGNAGFRGYMVFGFANKDFYILESIYTGNATYVLGQNWQEISQLTKEEILTQNLHEQRLVHLEGWEAQIDNLLS